MDKYPRGSLDHNLPLLVVSGLSTGPTKPLLTDPDLREQGVLIRSEIPPVESREAKTILQYVQETDATHLPWHSRDVSRKHKFKIRTIGREFLLPPRNARLPDEFETPLSPPVLHSPFSPLSPGSTLYPDGLIDTRWLEKHQDLIPSVCLCFYSLTSDSSLATLHDNQLKTDINALKNALSQSGHKCRLAVVILSDQSPSSMDVFQDRLENIRKSTALDPKTSLFVLPTQRAETELESAIDSVLTALFSQATEYYRDLGRHSRKKKGRGIAPQPTIPPTSGTSHTLSLQGWNVRYDFKAAVFSEFRQEMEVAQRSYEQAYETLLGVDVMETIPSWSSRFNDARLLADIIAIRILRCFLWTGQSTAAVRRWRAHRLRMADFIDRRGRGTQNYGWQAWEARWAETMANLIAKVDYPELDPSNQSLFRPPEKVLSAERLQPWEQLHHQGYWYRTAARHSLDRRKLAYLIPEDDRRPVGASATSPSMIKAYTSYDTYMCPEPYEEYPLNGHGTNHSLQIIEYLNFAKAEFQKRHQPRLVAEVALECSKELESIKAWQPLLELLAPLWRDMSFRAEGWWDINEAMSWALRAGAAHMGNAGLVVAIDWELLNKKFTRRPGWHYDIKRSLDHVQVDRTPEVVINDDQISSFISASFVFKQDEGRAGQTCPAQLSINSNAFAESSPVVLEEIQIDFEGSLRTIRLKHQANSKSVTSSAKNVYVTTIPLVETEISTDDASDEEDSDEDSNEDDSDDASQPPQSVILEGESDLSLLPGHTRVFEMNLPLREAGNARASAVQVSVAPETFTLKYTMKVRETNTVGSWYTIDGRKKITRVNPQSIKVLPRPPKMEIRFVNALKQYYAGEPIQVEVEMVNEEDVDANTKLDVHLYGLDVPAFKVHVTGGAVRSSVASGEEAKLNGMPVGTISQSQSEKATITVDPVNRPTAYDLTIKAWYNLVSDPGTPIVQIVAFQLNIVNPFEASYDLVPRLHDEIWPSLFDHEGVQELAGEDDGIIQPQGLAQKWCLITRFGSFAAEDLTILDLDVKVLSTHGSARCVASKNQAIPPNGLKMAPKTMEEAHFDVVAQKLSLDDRASSTADLAFSITWQRSSNCATTTNSPSMPNITTFLIDPFYVTVSEPRVLASVSYSTTSPGSPSSHPSSAPLQLLVLNVTIENPSSHFLTFGLTMEPSDAFAFSGAKTTTLNVLPLARRSITYRLLPLVRGAWIRPTLVVRDKYFQKVLKIIPTEGMKRDVEGILVWVPEEAELQSKDRMKKPQDIEGPGDPSEGNETSGNEEVEV
ncbi:Gryzun, putative trafficking through golgi-domain-containing protein [Pseudomassariella vexata]|uniref:Gryzun, putative trafficking through golgi-domain-containing protein n=1 Tax=Pseudomassariella vexata TaxID=1141098 RepID=A0A1Y2DPU7_9PEZI|nr:Gryzun, putative trafficking through golgi-domain-containing protein [Pseudomassariella vexata]ORY61199.1 Gryzun, putative trafficking through golgi-domain-containing protein [Pseudomassariella vexata]